MARALAGLTPPAGNGNREGVLAKFTFAEGTDHRWRVIRAEATPIWLSLKPTIRVIDLARAVEDMPSLDRRRSLYGAALDRITSYLDGRGAIGDGLLVMGI